MHALATIHCTECNAAYCAECDHVLHKHPTKKFHHRSSLSAPIFQFPPIHDFYADLRKLVVLISNSGPLRTYCATRLDIIENLFVFHTLLNDHLEHKVCGSIFYNIFIIIIYCLTLSIPTILIPYTHP
jgi:hypothetical protein